MVVLAPRFAVLASFAAIAALSGLPEAEGAAVLPRQAANGYNPYRSYSRRYSHPRTRAVYRRDDAAPPPPGPPAPPAPGVGGLPTLPLPPIVRRADGAGGSSMKVKPPGRQQINERYDPLDPLLQVGKIWIGDKPAPFKRDTAPTEVYGREELLKRHSHKVEQSAQRAHDNNVAHAQQRQASSSGSRSGSLDALAVSGVKINRRAPHEHKHDEKIFITGDYDTIKVADEKRDNAHATTNFGNIVPLGLVPPGTIPSTPSVPGVPHVARMVAHTDSIGVHLKSRKIVGNTDSVGVHLRRDQPDGVPGRIDIMSPTANATLSQRIASLVISSTAPDGTYQAGVPFILNASGSNSTQIYLVTRPDSQPDSSNSTMPSNSTSSDPSIAGPSNSTTSGSSSTNSTSSGFVKVALEIPMFNTEDVSMKTFCATFDPEPAQPAPLTVEDCMGPNETQAHKSQLFAYDPNTGIIRPMWFDGQDDGTGTGTSSAQDVDGDDSEGDDSSNMDDPSSSNSTDPATPGSSKIASVTAMGLAAKYPAFAHSFAAETNASTSTNSTSSTNSTMPANARNVTMIFVPVAPQIVSPQRADAMGMAGMDSSMGEDPSASNTTDLSSATATYSYTSAPADATATDAAAAMDYDTADSSFSTAYPTDSATAIYTSAYPTDTASAADYDDSDYDYGYSTTYSGTATTAQATPTDGLSATDADYDNSAPDPTATLPYTTEPADPTDTSSPSPFATYSSYSSYITGSSSVTGTMTIASFGLAASTPAVTSSTATPTGSVSSASDYTSTTDGTASTSAVVLDATSTYPAPTDSTTDTETWTTLAATATVAAAADVTATASASADVSATPTDSAYLTGSATATASADASATFGNFTDPAYPTGSATTLSAAAFDTSSTAYPTSTYASDDVSATLSASAGIGAQAVESSSSTGTTTASPANKTLGVEVYDPSLGVSASVSLGAQAVETTSTDTATSTTDTSTVTGTATTLAGSSASATMTPVSTDPYKWMFKRGNGNGKA
ncbi:hypothetical protein EIP91_011635 [Steccherinum ochraceum]|uniref:Uncharacterized protein n=1 Tax=Steccherinum ochraceum TaxID=92696 RepID=A0A4R0RY67_9APHY|nr:hypothetical protein EIP91_011635 [Steccherinum ochraceum]